LVVSIFILLLILVVNEYNQRKAAKKKNNMTHKEKRESFDSDIEAVAKEIKKRQS
jgi:hypothetical protein